MNRPLIIALILCLSPVSALAQVTDDEAAKQQRIEKYQDRRLIAETPKPESGDDKGKKAPIIINLRQGPDPIYHGDFVQLMDDESLTRHWNTERAKDWSLWLGTAAVGMPLGSLVFLQNFKGQPGGALAPFASPGDASQAANAGDLRAYALSAVGAGIALYGAYNLGLWVAENIDLYHPDRLDPEAIEPRVRAWNDTLRERLALDPSDIPSPPTPRPSPSPSPSREPWEDEPIGTPSAAVGGPDAIPNPVPAEWPIPLPVASPGSIPKELLPTPEPRPSIFKFYPNSGYPIPSMRPDPDATPTPRAPAPNTPSPANAPAPQK